MELMKKYKIKYLLWFLCIQLLLCNCNDNKKEIEPVFYSLDLSYSDGLTYSNSYYIDSTKLFKYYLNFDSARKNQYYYGRLSELQFHDLEKILVSVDSLKINQSYNATCNKCPTVKFAINTKMKKQSSIMTGQAPYKEIDALVYFLSDLTYKVKLTRTDSEYVFESRKNLPEISF